MIGPHRLRSALTITLANTRNTVVSMRIFRKFSQNNTAHLSEVHECVDSYMRLFFWASRVVNIELRDKYYFVSNIRLILKKLRHFRCP